MKVIFNGNPNERRTGDIYYGNGRGRRVGRIEFNFVVGVLIGRIGDQQFGGRPFKSVHVAVVHEKIKPFIVGTLGVASMRSADRDAANVRFSWSGGIGAKFMFSRNIGIRTEYRSFSTSTNFVGRGGWCDWLGVCYTFLTDKLPDQSQLAAGLIVAF